MLDVVRWLPDATPGEWWGQIPATKNRPPITVRMVTMRNSLQAAEKARQDARGQGYTVARDVGSGR